MNGETIGLIYVFYVFISDIADLRGDLAKFGGNSFLGLASVLNVGDYFEADFSGDVGPTLGSMDLNGLCYVLDGLNPVEESPAEVGYPDTFL